MLQHELDIFEKPVKKKQTQLNFYFGCSCSSNKANNHSKTKKTFSFSVPKFVKLTVEENWTEKPLAPFIKMENKQLIFAAKCVITNQLEKHMLKKDIVISNQQKVICPE